MSDTPRTDSALGGIVATHPHLIGALEEMALLKRENAKLREALGDLLDACDGNYAELVAKCRAVLNT